MYSIRAYTFNPVQIYQPLWLWHLVFACTVVMAVSLQSQNSHAPNKRFSQIVVKFAYAFSANCMLLLSKTRKSELTKKRRAHLSCGYDHLTGHKNPTPKPGAHYLTLFARIRVENSTVKRGSAWLPSGQSNYHLSKSCHRRTKKKQPKQQQH